MHRRIPAGGPAPSSRAAPDGYLTSESRQSPLEALQPPPTALDLPRPRQLRPGSLSHLAVQCFNGAFFQLLPCQRLSRLTASGHRPCSLFTALPEFLPSSSPQSRGLPALGCPCFRPPVPANSTQKYVRVMRPPFGAEGSSTHGGDGGGRKTQFCS